MYVRHNATSLLDVFADLKVAFALFDKDGDGAITVSELLSVMKSLGFKSDDMMVKKMIDRFDYDGEHFIVTARNEVAAG